MNIGDCGGGDRQTVGEPKYLSFYVNNKRRSKWSRINLPIWKAMKLFMYSANRLEE